MHEINLITYPQPVVSYSFKDHRGMLAFEAASVHPFPGGGVVLPLPMHTIYAAQHPGKPVHIYQLLAVCGAGLPKILIPEYLSNALSKILQTLDGC